MILSFVTVYPSPGEESKIIDLFDSMRGLIAIDPDCQWCRVLLERGENNAICYLERWRSWEALHRHLRSPHYSRVLEAMELSRLPPIVEYIQGKVVGGLDVIEHARLRGKPS